MIVFVWRYTMAGGATRTCRFSNFGSSAQLEVLSEQAKAVRDLCQFILPGSKRLITEQGMFGNNLDVLREDELFPGGGYVGGGGATGPCGGYPGGIGCCPALGGSGWLYSRGTWPLAEAVCSSSLMTPMTISSAGQVKPKSIQCWWPIWSSRNSTPMVMRTAGPIKP